MGEMLTNPWVIGIGSTVMASVIAGLILYYGFGVGKAKPRKQTSNHQEHPMPVSSHPVEEKSVSSLFPKEIFEYLDSLAPFQRESAAKNYVGIRVSWKVTLQSSFTVYNGTPNIIMKDNQNYLIVCPVDLEKYPELKVMKEGHQFRIEGEIDSVKEVGDIKLRNCRFHF